MMQASIVIPVWSGLKVRRVLRRLWWDHGIVLLFYLSLSLGVTWPLTQNFTSAITGMGDARHHLWGLWHTKQALLAREPLFSSSLLYYPHGVNLLTHALGPLMGILALPFWILGPEAAYNGALLVGFGLTGYGMYLLSRSLQFDRSIGLFAGTVYLMAPIHLSAVYGHLSKAFLGALPLVLLALNAALDTKRSRWWMPAVAGFMLLAFLQSAEQYVYAGLAITFFMLAELLASAQRWALVRRCLLIWAVVLAVTGPLLVMTITAANNPAIVRSVNLESFQHQPDLIQFFLPAASSRLLGPIFESLLRPYNTSGIETAVFLSWTGLILCVVALVRRTGIVRRWLLFTSLCVLLALGPNLKVLGQTHFTEFELPILLPYALLTDLPGFDFMRTPGRFMLLGFVSFSIAASLGLAWLSSRFSSHRRPVVAIVATALVLMEGWPKPWPQETLRPVPRFYQQIAQDGMQYGVFDLPIRPAQTISFDSWYVYYSSYYQMYQMVHGKGIASGYVSRPYIVHPLFGQWISDSINGTPLDSNIFLNGEPANRYANALYELARHGYRYVVYHKPQAGYADYQKDSWGESHAQAFIKAVFGPQPPLVDDELVSVFEIPPFTNSPPLTMTIALRESAGANWLESVTKQRWAYSPASFYVASPYPQAARLEIVLDTLYDSEEEAFVDKATASLQIESGMTTVARISTGKETRFPLFLSPGSQAITLTVLPKEREARGDHSGQMRFAIRSVNLHTSDALSLPEDILVDGQRQATRGDVMLVIYGDGWYEREDLPGTDLAWRWAKSPAELYIYSPSLRRVNLTAMPRSLHESSSANGTGSHGVMIVAVNDQTVERSDVWVGQPFAIGVNLNAGWNRVSFSLVEGNFRPIDFQPGNGDARELSFALAEIRLFNE